MSFILELIFEIGLELVLEVLVELGFHRTAEKLTGRKRSVFWLGLLYTVFGGILGGLSLLLFRSEVIESGVIALLYFVLLPLAAGFMLSFVSWVINRGIRPAKVFELEKFVYGVLFAAAFTLTRTAFD